MEEVLDAIDLLEDDMRGSGTDAENRPNVHEANGWAPIHGAAREGHAEVPQHLINGGADFDNNRWTDGPGMTPCYTCSMAGAPCCP